MHLYINSVNAMTTAMTTDDRKLCMVAKYFPARPQSGISLHTCMSINVIDKKKYSVRKKICFALYTSGLVFTKTSTNYNPLSNSD